MRSPRDVVLAYNLELWNERRYDLAEEIIAERVVRHEVGSVSTLTRAESLQRVVDAWDQADRLRVTLLHVVAQGELVSITYQCDLIPKTGTAVSIGSIEVFRVVAGQICEVWNAARTLDAWQ